MCRAIAERLGGIEVSVWDFLEEGAPFGSKAETLAHVATLEGIDRMRTIFALFRRSLELRLGQDGPLFILNGYWYKYAASELAYGVSAAAIAAAVADFPAPCSTFFLDLSPEEAWFRKGSGSTYERGLMRGGPAQENADAGRQFVDFQRRIRPHWEALQRQHGPWTRISAAPSPERVLATIEASL
jgi:dTMP kinase